MILFEFLCFRYCMEISVQTLLYSRPRWRVYNFEERGIIFQSVDYAGYAVEQLVGFDFRWGHKDYSLT